jgi:hypothetical protein
MIEAAHGFPSRYTWRRLPRAHKLFLPALVDAFALHDANALNGLRGRAAELNQQQPKDRSCTTDPAATRHCHSSPGSESVSNLAQERSEFGIVLRVRRTGIRDRKALELNAALA